MPNHITNRLKINGSQKEINEVLEFIKIDKSQCGDEIEGIGTIDFNKITPMPKWVHRGNLTKEDELKYGAEYCWYEWCCNNWGTKWNAYDQKDIRTKDNVIYFKTAWNNVLDLMQKLARIFPNIEFEYSYCSEDYGCNLGKYVLKDTEVINSYLPQERSKEAFELVFDIECCKPEDIYLEFDAESGTYIYNEY